MAGILFRRQLDLNSNKITNLAAGSSASDAVIKSQLDAAQTAASSRSNHTGTQLAATISDFDTAVRLSRLDQLAAPSNPVNMGSQRITAVSDPLSTQDAATMNYVDTKVATIANGMSWKSSVRAATTANITLSGTQTIDGVSVIAGDRVLVKDQTTGSQNGIYVVAAGAWARSADADSSAEVPAGMVVPITEGTANGDKAFILTTNNPITLNTTALVFSSLPGSVSSSTPTIFESDIGNGSATTFAIAHNFNSRKVKVTAYQNSSPWATVLVGEERTDLNTVTIYADPALTTNELHVIIEKLG